jgi:hypothetical protein
MGQSSPRPLPWIATAAFVASPYFLLRVAFIEPEAYLVLTALLGVFAFITIALGRRLWLIVLLPAIVLTYVHALDWLYPCWRYSNATWCGHFCDDDPCSCPEHAEGPSVYGAGSGCYDDPK